MNHHHNDHDQQQPINWAFELKKTKTDLRGGNFFFPWNDRNPWSHEFTMNMMMIKIWLIWRWRWRVSLIHIYNKREGRILNTITVTTAAAIEIKVKMRKKWRMRNFDCLLDDLRFRVSLIGAFKSLDFNWISFLYVVLYCSFINKNDIILIFAPIVIWSSSTLVHQKNTHD